MNAVRNYAKINGFTGWHCVGCEQADQTRISMMKLSNKGFSQDAQFTYIPINVVTGNIALNKWVIKLAPCATAASPSHKLAIECPTDTVIPSSDSIRITSSARLFSGASVIIFTFSSVPYTSVSVSMP